MIITAAEAQLLMILGNPGANGGWRAEVKGFGLDLVGGREARAIEAVNRWGRGLSSLCDEPVDIGLVENSGHIRF